MSIEKGVKIILKGQSYVKETDFLCFDEIKRRR